MILNRLLLEPNLTDGGNSEVKVAPAASTPATTQAPPPPSVPRTKSDKPSVGAKPKELPPESKDFQFKIDDPSLLDSDTLKAETPLDVAKALIDDKKSEPKKEEVKKEEPKKVEVQKEEPVQHVYKEEFKPIVPKSKDGPKEFDYTGYSQEETYMLKNMSIPAREKVIKLMQEKKDLEQYKNGQYLQHPDAYVLDPEFSKIQEDVIYYNKEAQYWQEQVIKIGNGEKWNPLTGFDKQGNPIVGAEQMPTPQAQEQARLNLNRLVNAAQTRERELQTFAGGYKQRIVQDRQLIQNERARRFGWVADPKIMDSTLTIDSGEEKSVKETRDLLINLFPPYMRNDIAVDVAADLFTAFQILAQENRELKSGQNIIQVQKKQEDLAEPTSASGGQKLEAGRQINGVKEFSLAGMPA